MAGRLVLLGPLLFLLLGLVCAMVAGPGAAAAVTAAGSDSVQEQQAPTPLIVPLRRAAQPPPSIPGDTRSRRLRKKRESAQPPSVNAAPLHVRPGCTWCFRATVKLPGGQEVDVDPDTGSSLLWLPTTMCDDCNEVTLDRDHPDVKSIRSVVDVQKAQAAFINCTSEQCAGLCSPAVLKDFDDDLLDRGLTNLKDVACGPHGGVCYRWYDEDAKFDMKQTCAFRQAYGDGTTQLGALVQGPVEIAGIKLQNMTWGALIQGEQHVLSEPRSGGVLGLQFSDSDEQQLSCAPRFLDTMEAETGLPKIVTFCGHEENPVMVLGGGDERLHEGSVLYAPLKKGTFFRYTTGIESAKLGDTPLSLPANSEALFDTGTSLAYFPQPFWDAMVQELQSPKYCVEMGLPNLCPTEAFPLTIFNDTDSEIYLPFNATDIARLPTLTFTLPNGPILELKGEDYLCKEGEDPDTGLPLYWLVLRQGSFFSFLMGQALLRKLYAEFDAENGRMGFATPVADCQKAAGF